MRLLDGWNPQNTRFLNRNQISTFSHLSSSSLIKSEHTLLFVSHIYDLSFSVPFISISPKILPFIPDPSLRFRSCSLLSSLISMHSFLFANFEFVIALNCSLKFEFVIAVNCSLKLFGCSQKMVQECPKLKDELDNSDGLTIFFSFPLLTLVNISRYVR